MFKSGGESKQEVKKVSGESYPFEFNFYDHPPLFEVTVEEFETCALDRLRVLAEIESCIARGRQDELSKIILTQCKKYMAMYHVDEQERTRLRRRDHLSHFVLRLAFCRSEDLRRRFVAAETILFEVRYDASSSDEKRDFLELKDLDWVEVSSEERARLGPQLEAVSRQEFKEGGQYFKVRWTRVPGLVEQRKVLISGGWAYVPDKKKSKIIYHEFETQLEKALEMTARLLPRLDEDNRLVPILNNLSQGFIAGVSSEWASASGAEATEDIKAEMIDGLAKKHFPLCMRTLHENLQRDRHLKHFGRLQYGLFLKVLGVSIEEAVVFWRKSFSRITDDKFNKEYRYNIRHSYGLEGKRANYPAKSCVQLLAPGPSDHGCPYRNYTPESLQTALMSSYSSLGLKTSDLNEIMATVKSNHYHVACTRVFELTHSSCGVAKGDGVGSGESVTHPNQYAARSIELAKEKESAMVVEG